MSNYTKTTDFEAKDSLPTGDSGKIIRGSEFETEFDAISTAIATKADTAGPTFTGTLTFETISDGTIGVTAFVDEDDMSSDSATLVPTQQSVKAYVDAQVTAQDLDFQADSGGALSIDLDSETLTFTGGTGIDTSGSGNAVTFAIDSTVTTLTGTQTLTNKTLTTPVISTISNTGTITLPTSTDTLVGRATTDTLTNKTLTSAVLNTSVSGTAVLDEDNMASNSATQLATQQSIKAYVDSQVGANNELSEVLSNGNTTGGTDIAVSTGDDITFADSSKAIFGASSDLQIYHDGSGSFVDDQGTGGLILRGTNLFLRSSANENYLGAVADGAVTIYHDNSAKLETTSTGINVTGVITTDGMTTSADINFGDNDKAVFGAGSDLQIYHDGSNSIIYEGGTGELQLRGNGPSTTIYNGGATETLAQFNNNGSVDLYYDNSKKLATTSSGIDVTGTVTADGLTVDGDPALNGNVTITNTGTGAAAGPYLTLDRNSSSPADSDLIGILSFRGRDDGANATDYGTIAGKIADVTGGTEDGVMLFNVISGGSSRDVLTLSHNESVFNNGSADQDFRVESDNNANMIFVNAGSDVVSFGTTDTFPGDGDTNTGAAISASGSAAFSRDGFRVVSVNRNTDDGTLIEFNKNGSEVGNIATTSNRLSIGSNDVGLFFDSTNERFTPIDQANQTDRDAAIDLGYASSRFKDLYLSGTANTGPINASSTIKQETTAGGFITLKRNDTTLTNNADVGAINFETTDTDDAGVGATILASGDGTGGGVKLRFYAGKASNKTERLTLYNSGVAVFNEDGLDHDFRVESDGLSHALFVDASANQVIIGNGTAIGSALFAQRFSSNNTYTTTNDTRYASGKQVIYNESNTTDTFAGITLLTGSSSGGTVELNAVRTSTALQSDFVIKSRNSDGNSSEKLRVKGHSGFVGIGTSSPAEELDISADAPSMQLSSTNASGRNYGLQSTNTGNFAFYDGTAGANRIIIDSRGDISIGAFTPAFSYGKGIEISGDTSSGVGSLGTRNIASQNFQYYMGNNVENAGAFVDEYRINGFAVKYEQGSANGDHKFFVAASGTAGNTISYKQPLTISQASLTVNEDSQDYDFRVESDGATHMLFVDAGNNRVGIGESSPDNPLHVTTSSAGDILTLESTNAGTGVGPSINLFRNSSSPADNDLGPAIYFRGENSAGGQHTYASVYSQFNDVTDGAEDVSVFHQISIAGTARSVLSLKNAEVVINDESQNVDFRVESDTLTHALFVDASSNAIGINNSAPSGVKLSVHGQTTAAVAWGDTSDRGFLSFDGSGNPVVRAGSGLGLKLQANASTGIATFGDPAANYSIVFNDDSSSSIDFRVEGDSQSHLLFADAGADAVMIGLSASPTANEGGIYIDAGGFIKSSRNGVSTKTHYQFLNDNGVVGSIATNASTTTYNTSSDARLKENIADADDAGELIDAIQVRQFDWIADGEHQRYGMVAQELNTVAPEAVSEGETEEDMMAVDYSKLVPMLIKEIQSLRARVAQLESN